MAITYPSHTRCIGRGLLLFKHDPISLFNLYRFSGEWVVYPPINRGSPLIHSRIPFNLFAATFQPLMCLQYIRAQTRLNRPIYHYCPSAIVPVVSARRRVHKFAPDPIND